MSELLKRLRKNSKLDCSILKNSKYFEDKIVKTRVPLLNVALSGKLDGGFPKRGIIQIAAPPKHFKTNFMIEIVRSFQDDCVSLDKEYFIVLYDSELGSTPEYYENAGVDTSFIDHRPVKSVEDLKSDIANLLENCEEGDNVLIAIDSIGMLRSIKETKDAIDHKETVDMTRAKAIKSLFRIITAESVMKSIPIIVVNHSYETLEMHSKEVASGGRGAQYAAHTLWFISKAQEKDKEELSGFRFTIKAGLSRYVKENAKFPIIARFGEGIDPNSGLFELAVEFGMIKSEKKGWYLTEKHDTQKRRADIEDDDEFMKRLLQNKEFCDNVQKKYSL